MSWRKIITEGEEARAKFLEGTRKIGLYVGKTMGPHGRNWIIQQKYSAPQIHNDGVEVARHVFLDEETEDMAVQTIVDIAMNTNYDAGDGTTTSVVIADSLIHRGFKEVELGLSPVKIAENIYEELPKVVKMLKPKKLGKDDLYKVVSTALRDWELGKKVSEMLQEVGVDGRIAVEENWETKRESEFEVVKGMKFLGKSVSSYFANSENGKEALWKDAYVLVTNEKIEITNSIARLINELKEKGKTKLVIVGGFSEGTASYGKGFLGNLIKARVNREELAKRGIEMLDILPLEAPTLTSEELKDVAAYTGATFIDTKAGGDVSQAKMSDLGFSREFSSRNDGYVHITGGKGDTALRIKRLKAQLEIEQDQMFHAKVRNRIAALNASIGVIKVGAPTEAEQTYRKEKITDAINAGRAALQEGVIGGGGVPLKEIADKLGEEHILYEALQRPFKQIQENAMTPFKVEAKVLDSYKVTRMALENACSAAAQIIASDGAIVDRRENLIDHLEKMVNKAMVDPKVDFRDESNRDLGQPTT